MLLTWQIAITDSGNSDPLSVQLVELYPRHRKLSPMELWRWRCHTFIVNAFNSLLCSNITIAFSRHRTLPDLRMIIQTYLSECGDNLHKG